MTMRADVPVYRADGLSAADRYRHEIERRITIGILPEKRRERITPQLLRDERKARRHADASQRQRMQSNCGCGQLCAYVKHELSDQLTARMLAPAAETIAEPLSSATYGNVLLLPSRRRAGRKDDA